MPISFPSSGDPLNNNSVKTNPLSNRIGEDKRSSKSLLPELTFPNHLSELSSAEHLFTSKTGEGEARLEDLVVLLNIQGGQIEQELEQLEKKKQNLELTDVILEIEELGEWAFEKFGSANERVAKGIEHLERLIPHHILSQLPSQFQFERVGTMTTFGEAYLTALNSGLSGLALIYKMKILQQSKEVLELMKKEALETELARDPTNGTNLFSAEEIEKKKRAIAEWEINIEMEEESLAEEMRQFELSSAANLLSLANLTLTSIQKVIPNGVLSKGLNFTFVAVPLIVSGIELILEGLELKKTSKDSAAFFEWKEAFLTWQKNHAKAWDATIKEAGGLQKKREKIMKEKMDLLKPQFENIVGKIEELKKGAYVREMQEILWNHLQDPNCTPKRIEEILKKWGFDSPFASSPVVSPKTAQLLQLLNAFKSQTEQMPSDQKEKFVGAFVQWMNDPAEMNAQFQRWFRKQVKENRNALIESYVLHHETIEVTTKNALKQMVQKKHEIEGHFIRFKLARSSIKFSVAALILAVTAALAILALVSLPFGGAVVLLIALAVGASLISWSLFGAGYLHAFVEKRQLTRLLSLRFRANLLWTRLGAAITQYSHQAKEKKLLEVAKILSQLHVNLRSKEPDQAQYQKALQSFKQAKEEFAKSQERANNWSARLRRLEHAMNEKSWEDFVKQASLQRNQDPAAFDTLRAFQEALNAADLSLLTDETKSLLEVQLGIDLKALQTQMSREGNAIRDTLQDFFVLDPESLVEFINVQQARMQRGLIEKPIQ